MKTYHSRSLLGRAGLTAFSMVASGLFGVFAQAAGPESVYTVRQTYKFKDLPAGAKEVRGWFWMPEDRPEQRILDFRVVQGPESLRVTRDPRYGRSWLYAAVPANPNQPLEIVTEFKVARREVSGLANPDLAGRITASHRRTFSAELNMDEKHMEVTPTLKAIADDLAGKETNPVLMARKFFDYVIQKSEHYSKSGTSPKGKCLGDAMECLQGTGDCCTDQHALFIALCRARGIPARLMYGSRLNPTNEGKDHDPGYRCWPNFFAPGLGWVPLDISSGDTGGERAGEWFGGLDANRLEWAEGRDFDFEPRSKVRPDLVIRGWVEVDGKPHTGLERVLNFQKVGAPRAEGSGATATAQASK